MTKAEIRSQVCETIEPDEAADQNSAIQATLPTGTIEGQFHPVVAAYFKALNAGDYATTASLFAANGVLLPPFESAIVGPAAILQYLNREAKGMMALPQSEVQSEVQSESQQPETESISLQVLGQVQTSLFSVNVSWQFGLNAEAQVVRLKIKLLATLKDLLHLKP
jgi:hypothetical protein